jgi:hypothetical protein
MVSVTKQRNRKWHAAPVIAGLLLVSCVAATGGTWAISQKIPVGTNVVRILPDPHRTWVYAIDRQNSEILFINLLTGSVQNKLYVGKDPTDFDIDATGNFLYIANKGSGTGLPGSWRIGVVALTNQTLVTSYITSVEADNVTAGRSGRLYYNSEGDAHALNTDTGTDLGSFAGIKMRMVILSNKTRLFGQYIYTGNLGAMGAFDVSSDQITLVDSMGYSPYPYGWDYDNYSLSGDDRYLAYGKILFNSTNFTDQIGLFQEQVYALNYNGTVAFGQTSIWDTTTFPIHGDATKITNMPFATTIMAFDSQAKILYAFNSADSSLYAIEQMTTHGIPFRWLAYYGLGTNDTVEAQDPDNDGLSNLQEWMLNSNPTNMTPGLQLKWMSDPHLTVQNTSPARWYELQRTTNLVSGTWQSVSQLQGSGSNLVFNVTADRSQLPKAFYRLKPKVY